MQLGVWNKSTDFPIMITISIIAIYIYNEYPGTQHEETKAQSTIDI